VADNSVSMTHERGRGFAAVAAGARMDGRAPRRHARRAGGGAGETMTTMDELPRLTSLSHGAG